jgi:hypothetical protein
VWVTARFDRNGLETFGEEGLVRGGGDGMISVFLRLGAHSAAPRTIGTNANCVFPAFPLRLYDCGYYSESVMDLIERTAWKIWLAGLKSGQYTGLAATAA